MGKKCSAPQKRKESLLHYFSPRNTWKLETKMNPGVPMKTLEEQTLAKSLPWFWGSFLSLPDLAILTLTFATFLMPGKQTPHMTDGSVN